MRRRKRRVAPAARSPSPTTPRHGQERRPDEPRALAGRPRVAAGGAGLGRCREDDLWPDRDPRAGARCAVAVRGPNVRMATAMRLAMTSRRRHVVNGRRRAAPSPRRARRRPVPPTRRALADHGSGAPAAGEQAHGLRQLERGQDERPAAARRDPDGPVRRRARARRGRSRAPPTTPARRAGGWASPAGGRPGIRSGTSAAVPTASRGMTTRPRPEGVAVHVDRLEAIADPEPDGFPRIVDGLPRAGALDLQPAAPEHERPMVLVLELVVAVDPAVDPHVAGRARPGERRGIRDGHERRSWPAIARCGSPARRTAGRGPRRRAPRGPRRAGRPGSWQAEKGRRGEWGSCPQDSGRARKGPKEPTRPRGR